MELSLTTFILEIVNFLVLVWILKRLFFAPVKHAIEARRAAVAKTMLDAKRLQADAEALRAQYEGRNREWDAEKAKARQDLDARLAEEKARRLEQIKASVESERQKMQAQDERKLAEQRESLERDAINHATLFSSRLLESVASASLEEKLITLALDRLREAGPAAFRLPPAPGGSQGAISCGVRTAYVLNDAAKEKVRTGVSAAIHSACSCVFTTEPSLIAGIEIEIDSSVIRANLRDELSYFARASQV